ncbi:MAG: ribosome maturation factor RimM [Anaerolineales bacterium]
MTETPDARSLSHVAVGRVIRPHGVRGALQVDAISDLLLGLQPGTVVTFGEEHWETKVIFLHAHRKRYLMAVEDCSDREHADLLRGSLIYLPAEAASSLPEGTYFHHQIVGLRVETEQGEALGHVLDILHTGANDVYIVGEEDGDELLIPAIGSVVQRIDLQEELMVVRLLPGLRSEPEQAKDG